MKNKKTFGQSLTQDSELAGKVGKWMMQWSC